MLPSGGRNSASAHDLAGKGEPDRGCVGHEHQEYDYDPQPTLSLEPFYDAIAETFSEIGQTGKTGDLS